MDTKYSTEAKKLSKKGSFFYGSITQWLTLLGILTLDVMLATRWDGKPAEWIAAVATAVLALTATIGLVGVLWPIQKERARRRRLHKKKLVTKILEPIREKLLSERKGVLERKFNPIMWKAGVGHEIKKNTGPLFVHMVYPTGVDNKPFDQLYKHIKDHHYPLLLGHYENLEIAFGEILKELLQLTKGLEDRIRAGSEMKEGMPTLEYSTVLYGSLAQFAFESIWGNARYPLSVNNSSLPHAYGWTLSCTNLHQDYAHGSERDMRQLQQLMKTLIDGEAQESYVASTEKLRIKLEQLLSEFAEVTGSEALDGDCNATMA